MVVKKFWKRWGITTLRCARSKTPIAVFWTDPYEVWVSPAKKSRGHFGHFTHKLDSGGSQIARNLTKMGKIGHFGGNELCVHPWSQKFCKKVVFWSHGISMAKICPQLNLSGRWGARVLFSNRKITDFWRFWGKNDMCKNRSF